MIKKIVGRELKLSTFTDKWKESKSLIKNFRVFTRVKNFNVYVEGDQIVILFRIKVSLND